MSEDHEHYYCRKNGEGPFLCACGATKMPNHVRPLEEPDHGSHIHIGEEHGAWLQSFIDPTGQRGVTVDELWRSTRYDRPSGRNFINDLMEQRRPDLEPWLENKDQYLYLLEVIGEHRVERKGLRRKKHPKPCQRRKPSEMPFSRGKNGRS